MRWLFLSQLWPLLKQSSFFEAYGAVTKIGSSLNQTTIGKFSLPKSVKHSVYSVYLLYFVFEVKKLFEIAHTEKSVVKISLTFLIGVAAASLAPFRSFSDLRTGLTGWVTVVPEIRLIQIIYLLKLGTLNRDRYDWVPIFRF